MSTDVSHPLRHYLYVVDQSTAETVAAFLRSEGFMAKLEWNVLSERWLIVAGHTIVPSRDVIAATRSRFEDIAAECRGEYEGWETVVMQEPSAL